MQRRYFFFGSLAALAADKAKAAPPADTIGVGMIGVGNQGSHILRLAMTVPAVKIAAVCDIKPDRLDKAATAAARDRPRAYSDYRKLLEDKSVEAVHISTPCDLHAPMAIAALQAGKHVYLEKPVGIEPKSIAELVRAARSAKTLLTVGQQMRSSARLKTVIPRIHEGICGKVVMIKAQRHAATDHATRNRMSADWFFFARRSGDVIVEMSVHNFDVCNWVLGQHPERAAGFGGTLIWVNDPPGRTNMDGYTLSFEYPGGAKLSYSQVFFHPAGLPHGGQYWLVYGTKGAVDLDNGVYYPLEANASAQKLWDAQQKDDQDLAHVAAFYAYLRGTGPNPCEITIGAVGALTGILGREAIYQKRVLAWRDLGVAL
jgi:predicted dehydrogenase